MIMDIRKIIVFARSRFYFYFEALNFYPFVKIVYSQ